MLLWIELQNLLYSWKYRLHQPTEQMPIQPIKHRRGGGAVLLCVLHVYSLHLINVLHRPGQLGTCIASVLFCCYCIYELCLDQGTCTRATTTCDGPRWNTLAHMLGQTIIQLHHPAHPLVSSCWLAYFEADWWSASNLSAKSTSDWVVGVAHLVHQVTYSAVKKYFPNNI